MKHDRHEYGPGEDHGAHQTPGRWPKRLLLLHAREKRIAMVGDGAGPASYLKMVQNLWWAADLGGM